MSMSARLFTKKADLTPLDYRQEKKYRAAMQRLEAVQAEARERRDRLGPMESAIAAIRAELDRAEMEVLAGRGSENTLAAVQARHTAARVARAKEKLALEDLEAEERTLATETIPTARQAAKRAALASIRRAYRAILGRLRAGLDAALDADADLAQLITDTSAQFGPLNPYNDTPDQDGVAPCAGLQAVAYTYISLATGAVTGQMTVEGRVADLLKRVDEVTAALDAAEARDSAQQRQPAENAGLA